MKQLEADWPLSPSYIYCVSVDPKASDDLYVGQTFFWFDSSCQEARCVCRQAAGACC